MFERSWQEPNVFDLAHEAAEPCFWERDPAGEICTGGCGQVWASCECL